MTEQSDKYLTIIIPVFNRAHLLADSLNSLIAQTNPNWECIVVDDGSSDNTRAVVESFCNKESRIKLLSRQRAPKGAATCRNIGLEQATSNLISFLDSDDVLLDYFVEQRLESAKHYPDEFDFLLFPNVEIKNQKIIRYRCLMDEKNPLDSFLSFNSTWQTASPLWKKSFLTQIGGWDESALSWQDGEVHIRALLNTNSFKWVDADPDVLIRISDNETSISSERSVEKVLNLLETIDKIYHELPESKKHNFSFNATRFFIDYLEQSPKKLAGLVVNTIKKEFTFLESYSLKKIKRYIKIYNSSRDVVIVRNTFYQFRKYLKIFGLPKRNIEGRRKIKVPAQIEANLMRNKCFEIVKSQTNL